MKKYLTLFVSLLVTFSNITYAKDKENTISDSQYNHYLIKLFSDENITENVKDDFLKYLSSIKNPLKKNAYTNCISNDKCFFLYREDVTKKNKINNKKYHIIFNDKYSLDKQKDIRVDFDDIPKKYTFIHALIDHEFSPSNGYNDFMTWAYANYNILLSHKQFSKIEKTIDMFILSRIEAARINSDVIDSLLLKYTKKQQQMILELKQYAKRKDSTIISLSTTPHKALNHYVHAYEKVLALEKKI